MLAAALLAWCAPGQAQSLIEGLDGYADAVTGRTTAKWVGQRVPWPLPKPRPESEGQLVSALAPLAVHAGPGTARRLPAVLRAAEQVDVELRASGLFTLAGDAGQGGTHQRDLYLVDQADSRAELDATQASWDLDGARAYARVDARVPDALLPACVAQALIEAELLELDPAEAEAVRVGSAAYFAELLVGDSCPVLEPRDPRLPEDTLRRPSSFAAWLRALGARQDHNRGVFVQNMWHFARQRTWEGSGLRGSPDLLEAISAALQLAHEKLEEVAGELSARRALRQGELSRAPRVTWSALPAHRPAFTPELAPLDGRYLVVDLEQARAGARLSVWLRGESPVRWVLSATRLTSEGAMLSTVNAPVRKYPEAELHVELDASTRFVLISVTQLGTGKPDADVSSQPLLRSARLIVDRGK